MIVKESLFSIIRNMRKFIDIGANLTDGMYRGEYHGSKKHTEDLEDVLKRCWQGGMQRMIITGGSHADCVEALQLAQKDDRLFTTIGCHPTRCGEFKDNPEEYLDKLKKLKAEAGDKVVAIGECGLDYDRLHFCDKETQKIYFKYQLQLCSLWKLPLFLHCRAAWDDFFQIVQETADLHGGVVHSFDGSVDNMEKAIEMGFHIGINGCSLKTAENLDVASKIPLERLLVETDCPWCEIRPTHAGYKHIKTHYPSVKKEKFSEGSMIKGRNEPINIIQVLEVLSGVRREEPDVLCEKVYQNTVKVFFPDD